MATEMNPPFSDVVVHVADDAAEAFKAAGWTEAKASARKSADKK